MIINPFWFGAGNGGDNPPVTANLILNWQADTIAIADGQHVNTGEWLDSFTSNNHPVNADTANSPIYRATGGPGSRPTVEFDAIGGSATASFFDLTNQIIPSDFTMFAILKHSDANPRTMIAGPSGAFQWRISSNKQEVLRAGITLYGTSTTSLSTSAFNKVAMTFNNSTRAFTFRLNGVADGSGTGGGLSPSANCTQVARNQANVTTREPFLGFISALLIYDRILSGTEITDVEDWLTTRWGV